MTHPYLKKTLNTPYYIIDRDKIEENLKILNSVKNRTGCKILLALKAFSNFKTFPLISKYLDGVCASSLNEARLGKEEFGKEVHTYSPAYKEEEFGEISNYSDHIIFNSFSQLTKFKTDKKIGLRVNPGYSEVKTEIYDPCKRYSRLGVSVKDFDDNYYGLTGLHFHNLCESSADSLERTLEVFEKKFKKFLFDMYWINFGGGHLITKKDYNIDLLCRLIDRFRQKYDDIEVYLEPGEAVVLNAGYLVTTVLDIIHNEVDIAILDISAATHAPDVLEMPYKPEIIDANDNHKYSYRLGGISCLAGDEFGTYSFKVPLEVGQKLVLNDMAQYTMVKNNFFNGINLPSIVIENSEGIELIREFGYEDYKNRL